MDKFRICFKSSINRSCFNWEVQNWKTQASGWLKVFSWLNWVSNVIVFWYGEDWTCVGMKENQEFCLAHINLRYLLDIKMEMPSYQFSMNLEFQRSQDWWYTCGNLHLKYLQVFPILNFLWITQSQPKGLSLATRSFFLSLI